MKKLLFFGGVVGALASLILLAGPYPGGNGPYAWSPLNGILGNNGYLYVNAPSTNLGSLSTNTLNILISPDIDIGVFTNAQGATAIGAANGSTVFGMVRGNGIKVGQLSGQVGTNCIAVGNGASAIGLELTGLGASPGAGTVAIGTGVTNWGKQCIVIGNSKWSHITNGSLDNIFIGEFNEDQGTPTTNTIFIGHGATNITLAPNTLYLGSVAGGGVPSGTTGIVCSASAIMNGNGAGITNIVGDSNTNYARVYRNKTLLPGGNFLAISGTAYFVYVGQVNAAFVPQTVEIYCTVVEVGAQTAELGLFSSPAPPNKAGQTLSKITSTGTITSMLATGVIKNTTPFNTSVAAGTYLWAGFRTAAATTQPTLNGVSYDMVEGNILTTAGASALTTAGPFVGATIAVTTATVGPDIRVTIDP